MGKKSKKNAGKSKGQLATAAVAEATASVESTALVSANTKKQRCVSCCSLLKDIGNIRPCPGCSDLYCWRCERKSFLACPNADNCASSLSRCAKCASGKTMLSKLATVRIMPLDCFVDKNGTPLLKKLLVPDLLKSFELLVDVKSIVHQNQGLTANAAPLLLCGAETCTVNFGCANCIDCSSVFQFCSRCDMHRCSACVDPFKDHTPIEKSKLIMLMMSVAGSWEAFQRKYGSSFGWTDGMASCSSCRLSICYECLVKKEAKRMMQSFINRSFGYPSGFLCDPCYWMTKPCANVACPNELGSVQTKRCSGCHIVRYCSVECQAAAYPEHMERCKRIGDKLIASGKYVADERGCHNVEEDATCDERIEELQKKLEWIKGCCDDDG